jgi:hypothetical protein
MLAVLKLLDVLHIQHQLHIHSGMRQAKILVAGAREGLREWSGEGEGFFAHDATYGYDELFALMQSRGVVTIRFSNETSGDEYHEGQAFLTELSADAPVEDSTTFSFSFQGTGALNYKALT